MPLLIVPSHHSSPDSLKGKFNDSFSSDIPVDMLYSQREGGLQKGVLVATKEALDKILIDPRDNFRSYSYRQNNQKLSVKDRKEEEIDWDRWSKDQKDPSRSHFTKGYSQGFSSTSLITIDSEDARCMKALIDVLGKLPIVPVLQAYLFDPKYFSELEISGVDVKDLSNKYPFGFLSYPKRIWPEFYHAHTGESLLRISHHPDKDNYPHGNAFFTDPRLGEVKEGDNYQEIKTKFRDTLMPILRQSLKDVNKQHKKSIGK